MPGMGPVDQAHAFRQALTLRIQEELVLLNPQQDDLEDIKAKALLAENKLAASAQSTSHLKAMQSYDANRRQYLLL